MFNIIDFENWNRREYFNKFFYEYQNLYSITFELEITELYNFIKKENYRFYPTFIYLISNAVNNFKEFKMDFDDEKRLGYYDVVHPSYAIFNDKEKLFTSICTHYNKDFKAMYENILLDKEKYKNACTFFANSQPKNSFCISCFPWASYTSFSVNTAGTSNPLLPIILCGKFFYRDNKLFIPFTVSIHHAVADGYHTGIFINFLQDLCLKPKDIINI